MVDTKHGHGKDSVTEREGAVIRAGGSKTIVEVGARKKMARWNGSGRLIDCY